MRYVLNECEATRHTVDEHFIAGATSFDSVRSTLAVAIGEYEAIALAWEDAFKSGEDRVFRFRTGLKNRVSWSWATIIVHEFPSAG